MAGIWSIAAGLGLAIRIVVFVVAAMSWRVCSHLRKAGKGRNIEEELRNSKVDWI